RAFRGRGLRGCDQRFEPRRVVELPGALVPCKQREEALCERALLLVRAGGVLASQAPPNVLEPRCERQPGTLRGSGGKRVAQPLCALPAVRAQPLEARAVLQELPHGKRPLV